MATLEVAVGVHPATEIGNAASLAVGVGLDSVTVSGSGLDDQKALERDALRAAIDNARDQAELIAMASGGRIGKIVRINRGGPDGERVAAHGLMVNEVIVTGSRTRAPITPEVALKLTAPKVTASTSVLVVYGWTP